MPGTPPLNELMESASLPTMPAVAVQIIALVQREDLDIDVLAETIMRDPALAARVLKAEHEIYPMALRMLAEGRVRMEGDRSVFSGRWPAGQHDATMIVSPPRAPEPEDIERLARFTP
jgi:hypothetical protein